MNLKQAVCVTLVLIVAVLAASAAAQAAELMTFFAVSQAVGVTELTNILVTVELLTTGMAPFITVNINTIVNTPWYTNPWTVALAVGDTEITVASAVYIIRNISASQLGGGLSAVARNREDQHGSIPQGLPGSESPLSERPVPFALLPIPRSGILGRRGDPHGRPRSNPQPHKSGFATEGAGRLLPAHLLSRQHV